MQYQILIPKSKKSKLTASLKNAVARPAARTPTAARMSAFADYNNDRYGVIHAAPGDGGDEETGQAETGQCTHNASTGRHRVVGRLV